MIGVTVPLVQVFVVLLFIARELLHVGEVAYVAILLAGAWVGGEKKRIFCTVALVTLYLSRWSGVGEVFVLFFGGLGRIDQELSWFAGILQQVETLAISIFAGWIALKSIPFWRPETSGLGAGDP